MKTYLKTADAAEYLNISKRCLEKSRVTGELYGVAAPSFIRLGNIHTRSKILYPITNLNEWLSNHQQYQTVAESAEISSMESSS